MTPNPVQKFSFGDDISKVSGSFKLQYAGKTTDAIKIETDAAKTRQNIRSALEALGNFISSPVKSVKVTGTGTSADPWAVEFISPSGADVQRLTVVTEGLALKVAPAAKGTLFTAVPGKDAHRSMKSS